MGLAIIATVVFVEQGQRRLPVQYAKRMIGRRMYGGTSTYLPLKVNQAGVIPVIFASSLLYIPALIVQLLAGSAAPSGTVDTPDQLSTVYWSTRATGSHILLYFALIIFFTYFYVGITVQPDGPGGRAEEVRRLHPRASGRAGRPPSTCSSCSTGSPCPARSTWASWRSCRTCSCRSPGKGNNQNFPFGGTAVLIMVGVGLDTVKQIETQLMQRNYEGFLR